jgi:hypothetical protein
VYPNGLNGPDTVNNTERIRISGASSNDAITVRVRGSNLNSASQNYALILTGCFTEGDPPPVMPVAPTPSPTKAPVVSTAPLSPFPTSPTMPSQGRPTVGETPAPITTGGRPTVGDGPNTLAPSISGGRPTVGDPNTMAPSTPGGRPTTSGPDLKPGRCVDGDGTIFVDDLAGYQPCTWLASNIDDYPWLCRFRDVAIECLGTCGACDLADLPNSPPVLGEPQNFGVAPNGLILYHGNMFNVEVIKDMMVTGMFLHLRSKFETRNVGHRQLEM